jgi:hypothetical protein
MTRSAAALLALVAAVALSCSARVAATRDLMVCILACVAFFAVAHQLRGD